MLLLKTHTVCAGGQTLFHEAGEVPLSLAWFSTLDESIYMVADLLELVEANYPP